MPANARVVARLTDHTPLLLDKKIGEGRVLLFASGLDNLTNDLPLHPAFVAFVEQTARYLSGAERPGGARQVDSFFELRTAQEHEPDADARRRGRRSRRPPSAVVEEAATAQSLRLTRAGFYQIRWRTDARIVVGVNPDRRESNLDVMPDDVQALWRGSPKPARNRRPLRRTSAATEDEPLQCVVVHNVAGVGGGAVGVVAGQPVSGHSARGILKREAP